jgi:hypothetical protein
MLGNAGNVLRYVGSTTFRQSSQSQQITDALLVREIACRPWFGMMVKYYS